GVPDAGDRHFDFALACVHGRLLPGGGKKSVQRSNGRRRQLFHRPSCRPCAACRAFSSWAGLPSAGRLDPISPCAEVVMRCVMLLTAIFSLAFAPAPLPKPDTGKDDLAKMQGEWVRVRYTRGGQLVAGVASSTVTIAKDHLRYGSRPGVDEWVITL